MELQESKADALKRLTSAPVATMEQISRHIISGGTLIELCETWAVPYIEVVRWIKEDNARAEVYNQARLDRAEWVEERILRELRLIATANPANAYNADGTIKPIDQIDEATQRVIQSIEVDELFSGFGQAREQVGVTKKIRFWSKTEAIQLAAKNLGLLIDRKELTIARKLEDIIAIEEAEVIPTNGGLLTNEVRHVNES